MTTDETTNQTTAAQTSAAQTPEGGFLAGAGESITDADITSRRAVDLEGPCEPAEAKVADLARPGRLFLPRIGDLLHGGPVFPGSHLIVGMDLDAQARTVRVSDIDLADPDADAAAPRTVSVSLEDLAPADPVRRPHPPIDPAHRAQILERATGALAALDMSIGERIDGIVGVAHAFANEHGWGREFDEIAEDLGLPTRPQNFTAMVTISFEVDVPVSAASAEDVEDAIGHDLIARAVAEHKLNVWEWHIEDVSPQE